MESFFRLSDRKLTSTKTRNTPGKRRLVVLFMEVMSVEDSNVDILGVVGDDGRSVFESLLTVVESVSDTILIMVISESLADSPPTIMELELGRA